MQDFILTAGNGQAFESEVRHWYIPLLPYLTPLIKLILM